MNLNTPLINRLIDSWLDEDLGRGDLTSCALNSDCVASAHWVANEEGMFCGGELVKQIFKRLDDSVDIELLIDEGGEFTNNQRLLEIQGPGNILIAGERTALNLGMHLSGITTATAYLVKSLEGTGVRLADTRKTTPGLRVLEKYAVRCGGGVNHRLGLDDTAMLKENHIAWSNGIRESVKAIKASAPWTSRIIVEAETAQQAKEAVLAGADGVLLDSIPPEVLKPLIPLLRDMAANRRSNDSSSEVILEASGVEIIHLKKYAQTGVDLISTSTPITRSSWIDFSMRFD